MRYMLLIYEDESLWGEEKDGPLLEKTVGRHMALAQSLGATLISGAGLKETSTATTVRTTAGTGTIHDGPFAETKEQLGGYYLVDVPDLDSAIEIAKRIPLPLGGSIEIRPTLGADGGGA